VFRNEHELKKKLEEAARKRVAEADMGFSE
jgi:hypothetical protein